MHASVPGLPGASWEDQLRGGLHYTASAPPRLGGQPGSPHMYFSQVSARVELLGKEYCQNLLGVHLPSPEFPVLAVGQTLTRKTATPGMHRYHLMEAKDLMPSDASCEASLSLFLSFTCCCSLDNIHQAPRTSAWEGTAPR